MNLQGYEELDAVLVAAGVPASIHQHPQEGEDLHFLSIELEIEQSSDEPMALVADILNAFVASGHYVSAASLKVSVDNSPQLRFVAATEYSLLLKDVNAQKPGALEVR